MSDTDSIYEFTFNPDGSIKINASKAAGGEQAVLKELNDLAAMSGGTLKVEKHNPGIIHRDLAGQMIRLKK